MKRNDASEVMCMRHLAEDKIKEKLLKLYFLTGFSPISLSENVFKFSKKSSRTSIQQNVTRISTITFQEVRMFNEINPCG